MGLRPKRETSIISTPYPRHEAHSASVVVVPVAQAWLTLARFKTGMAALNLVSEIVWIDECKHGTWM